MDMSTLLGPGKSSFSALGISACAPTPGWKGGQLPPQGEAGELRCKAGLLGEKSAHADESLG